MLRTQVSELDKRIRRIPGADPAPFDSVKREVEQLKQEVSTLRHDAVETGQLRLDVQKLRQELAAGTGQLRQDVQQLRQELAGTGQQRNDIAQIKQELAQASQLRNELTQLRNATSQLPQDVANLKKELETTKMELNKAKKDLEDVGELGSELQRMKELSKQMTIERKAAEKELAKLKQELNSMNSDFKGTQQELQGQTRKGKELERDISEVKKLKGTRELEDNVGQLKTKFGSTEQEFRKTTTDFYHLKQRLEELGLLRPPKVELADDEPVPVGTIELGEDCFTARLLIKLVYTKARELLNGPSSDSDNENISENDSLAQHRMGEQVLGISEPQVAEGERGSGCVTYGWLFLCLMCMFVQLLIVTILVMFAQSVKACFAADDPPSKSDLLILHVSKAAAITVAGALMSKDFMDIVNCQMVSTILSPALDWEILLTNVSRACMIALTGVTNLFLMDGMIDPVSVWVNMTALTFVSELGGAFLDQGKKGVFGHYIRTELTSLNYQLTFLGTMPSWIGAVQTITMGTTLAFVLVNAVIVYRAEDCVE